MMTRSSTPDPRACGRSAPNAKCLAAVLALIAGLCTGSGAAQAQQGAAIRQACASDYRALCTGVQPGGGRIIACLQHNAGKLSADCQKALDARAAR